MVAEFDRAMLRLAEQNATYGDDQRGDIIFGHRRAYQRKLAVAGEVGICSAHATVGFA